MEVSLSKTSMRDFEDEHSWHNHQFYKLKQFPGTPLYFPSSPDTAFVAFLSQQKDN